jgi:hypothetical protein
MIERLRARRLIEREQVGEVNQRPRVCAVVRDRTFEDRPRIEPPAAARQHDAERDERFHFIGHHCEHGLERRDRIVEAAVIAQERGVVEARVERVRCLRDRAFEIGKGPFARIIGGPALQPPISFQAFGLLKRIRFTCSGCGMEL